MVVGVGLVLMVAVDVVMVVLIVHLVRVVVYLPMVVHAEERFSVIPVVVRQGHYVVHGVPGGVDVSVVVGRREAVGGPRRSEGGGR